MIPAAFRYERPQSVAAAIGLLADPEAKVLAGGQSLLPLLRLRMAEPGLLVDIQDIADLRGMREAGGDVLVGALTPHAELASRAPWRVLREAAELTGDRQVRRLGTIGGAIAHADPAGDLPAALLALDGRVEAEGPEGRRTLPIGEFFVGPLTTALAPQELLVALRIPLPGSGAGSSYRKFRQKASGFALAGVGAVVRMEAGRCRAAGLGVTGVGLAPYAAVAAASRLVGTELAQRDIEAALELILDGVDVQADAYASPDYRARICRLLAAEAITRARAEARG